MTDKTYTGVLISDFTVDGLSGYFDNDSELPAVKSVAAPFNQVVQVLTDKGMACWKKAPEFAVVWTRPEGVIASFNQTLDHRFTAVENILEEVDAYCALILGMGERVRTVFVPTWLAPASHRGMGMLDMTKNLGVSNTLMRMNLRLAENLEKASNIFVMDAQRWTSLAGRNAFNPKLWYMGKVAFGNAVFSEAVKDMKSALRGLDGHAKKLIVLDLDDTLWGGVVGEVGLENIRLGGHDQVGEAFQDFQRALRSLTHRGILLGIVSKNEEATALDVIKRHPEMVLRAEDFAGWKINWKDKAQNLVDLAADLNLGRQSAVFIDNNPVERARVRQALPEVFVPDWPDDSMLYKSALLSLRCFDAPSLGHEDAGRTKAYTSERQRKALKVAIGSVDDWLESLEMTVAVEGVSPGNIQRLTQLLNKTNQMNLATRRLSENELSAWANQKGHELWGFRVSDKYGDSGLTGMVSLEAESTTGRIVDFLLSCRVVGRRVEESILYKVISHARSAGLKQVVANFIPTEKNKPCLEFWKRSGFKVSSKDGSFRWNTNKPYPAPPKSIQYEDRSE